MNRQHILSLFAFIALMTGCAPTASTTSVSVLAAPQNLPVSIQSDLISYRAESRQLTGRSAAVTVELVTKTPLQNVTVTVIAADSTLSVTPTACKFNVLNPPHLAHAARPPYPLPAVPLCTFVVTAPSPGRYPITLQVRTPERGDLLKPVNAVLVIKGEKS